MNKLIVCAAIRSKKDKSLVITGLRHGDCFNLAARFITCKSWTCKSWECGFIDSENNFLTRKEAWKIADAAGQIRRPFGIELDYSRHRIANIGDDGVLFSENLY